MLRAFIGFNNIYITFLKRVIPGKCVLKVLLLTTWPSHTCVRLLASKCALTNLKHGQVCNKRFKVLSGDVFCVIRLAGGHVISNNYIYCIYYNAFIDGVAVPLNPFERGKEREQVNVTIHSNPPQLSADW